VAQGSISGVEEIEQVKRKVKVVRFMVTEVDTRSDIIIPAVEELLSSKLKLDVGLFLPNVKISTDAEQANYVIEKLIDEMDYANEVADSLEENATSYFADDVSKKIVHSGIKCFVQPAPDLATAMKRAIDQFQALGIGGDRIIPLSVVSPTARDTNIVQSEGQGFAMLSTLQRRIMDTGASSCMTGNRGRLSNIIPSNVTIHGFNNAIEKAAAEGLNDDGIRELLIESMGNVTLASASEYTRVGGATVLFAEDGYVLQLDPTELLEFKKVISKCKKFIELEVVDNIYEIKSNYMHNDVSTSRVLGWGDYIESYVNDSFNEQDKHSAMSASTYFNGKVNFNGIDELILYMQFGGFSTEQLKNIINYDMIRGMHPSITLAALREYERVHGSNPALLQKSMAKNIPPSPRYDKGPVRKWEIGEKNTDRYILWEIQCP
jgi:hypothetical protein